MGSQYLSIVSKSIAEQLSEYRASMSEDAPTIPDPTKGSLDDEDASWWEGWRKRLRTEKGYVKIGVDENGRKRKISSSDVKKDELELVGVDADIKPLIGEKSAPNQELRVILKVRHSILCPILVAE
jgi:SWI/SNF-related matrix-associated actin-dependent regulator of chromatin subfamily B member 1